MFSGTLTLRQNKPFAVTFIAEGTDVPVLTGFGFRMTVRKSLGKTTALMLAINTAAPESNATVDVPTKTAFVDVTAAVTKAIAGPDTREDKWVADAVFYHADGRVVDLGSYRVVWEPEVPGPP